MTTAIEKGLVKTRPVPAPVTDIPSFSITAITNPNNGKYYVCTLLANNGTIDLTVLVLLSL